MMMRKTADRKRSWLKVGLAVMPVVIALLLGQWATFSNIEGWYAGLAKPAFNPPNWIFGPVWTCLYALMSFAVWRIWILPGDMPQRSAALTSFYLQLALNAAWSWAFFALHSPFLGLINIIPQWILILLTIHRFRLLDSLAAYSLAPLAIWVAFAIALNFAIWRLNS
ncbi:TspO/MBR family protein [Rhizobium miluonense]|jgi:tryptophan-rich sensory protein|uniref:Tryptophan-rich sensory protein n=1 Tax=Rhizobium miluonense TaxID=411945 RepID=A0ABU1SXZ8_9HYPH|nr:TspO/MBR family protein [Rhizobium miluonense]MDR6903758.1 tryptophan-rich sensory protein [Rhizobium miluonense]